MFKYQLINELPEEFGELKVIACFNDKDLAILNFRIIKGYLSTDKYIGLDSYTYHYLVLRDSNGKQVKIRK